MDKVSLRDELAIPPLPTFDLALPRGWQRRTADKTTENQMIQSLRRRLMEQHSPHLFPEARDLLERSFKAVRENGVIAFFCPTDPDPRTVAIPASINASIRSAEPGRNLDEVVLQMIRSGAKPLFGDPRTMRLEREKVVTVGEEAVVNHSVVYITPVPGSSRRKALQLVAGFARMPDVSVDAPSVQGMRALFDACVSTLTWKRVEGN